MDREEIDRLNHVTNVDGVDALRLLQTWLTNVRLYINDYYRYLEHDSQADKNSNTITTVH